MHPDAHLAPLTHGRVCHDTPLVGEESDHGCCLARGGAVGAGGARLVQGVPLTVPPGDGVSGGAY